MSAQITEILRAGYLGKLPTIRLLQLTAGLTTDEAARFCRVSPHTFRRWRSDRQPPPAMQRLLAIRAGYLPWPDWHGWEMHNGLLFPPGFQRHGLQPDQVAAAPYLLHLTRELSRRHAVTAPAEKPRQRPWWRLGYGTQ